MSEKIKKVPYRPITVLDLTELLRKYNGKEEYDIASKLLVDEKLLILKKTDEQTL